MSDVGFYVVTKEGVKVKGDLISGGYHKVSFSRDEGEETCQSCPCVEACLVGPSCVKKTAFVTERLK